MLISALQQLTRAVETDKEPSLASVKHLIVGAAPISGTVFEQLRRVMPQCDAGQGVFELELHETLSIDYPIVCLSGMFAGCKAATPLEIDELSLIQVSM